MPQYSRQGPGRVRQLNYHGHSCTKFSVPSPIQWISVIRCALYDGLIAILYDLRALLIPHYGPDSLMPKHMGAPIPDGSPKLPAYLQDYTTNKSGLFLRSFPFRGIEENSELYHTEEETVQLSSKKIWPSIKNEKMGTFPLIYRYSEEPFGLSPSLEPSEETGSSYTSNGDL